MKAVSVVGALFFSISTTHTMHKGMQEDTIMLKNLTDHTTLYAAVYIQEHATQTKAHKQLYGGVYTLLPGHAVNLNKPVGFKWKFGIRSLYFSTDKDDLVHQLPAENLLTLFGQYIDVGSNQGKSFAIAPAILTSEGLKIADWRGSYLMGGIADKIAQAYQASCDVYKQTEVPLL